MKLQNEARFVRDLRVSRAGLRRLKIKFEKVSESESEGGAYTVD